MNYNDNRLQWETKKWESKHDHESTLYCFVFHELGADRQPWIPAFDRRQARQKRCNRRSVRMHILILWFSVLIVAHYDALELFIFLPYSRLHQKSCFLLQDYNSVVSVLVHPYSNKNKNYSYFSNSVGIIRLRFTNIQNACKAKRLQPRPVRR